MEGIDWLAQRGLGPWLQERRKARRLTQADVSQATGVPQRTIQRYEADRSKPGYETLRILDALGVKLRPAPASATPASVNTELRELRRAMEERGVVEPAGWPAEVVHRLEAVEAKVDSAAEGTAETLDRIAGAIARIEARLDEEDDQRRKAQ